MKTILWKSEADTRKGALKALIVFAFAVIIQSLLITSKIEMPQKTGESLLALISDDTRMVLSSSMMTKADDYFHGGVRALDCTLEKHAAEALTEEHGHDHDHSHSHPKISVRTALKQPFTWINSQIHAQEHRHLEDDRSVELLPWVSAAVMASPHNIQAYESGSYILKQMVGKPDLAIAFLEQGVEHNPDNVTLEISLAEIYFNTIKDSEKAFVHLDRAMNKSLAKGDGLTDDDRFERLKICFYLGAIAKDKHDIDQLGSVCRMASEINPDSVMTHALHKWLREEMEKQKE